MHRHTLVLLFLLLLLPFYVFEFWFQAITKKNENNHLHTGSNTSDLTHAIESFCVCGALHNMHNPNWISYQQNTFNNLEIPVLHSNHMQILLCIVPSCTMRMHISTLHTLRSFKVPNYCKYEHLNRKKQCYLLLFVSRKLQRKKNVYRDWTWTWIFAVATERKQVFS